MGCFCCESCFCVGSRVDNGTIVHIEDVAPSQVWDRLTGNPRAVLIDVRTRAEWTFVGVPDLSALGRQVVTIEWLTFPDNRIDPLFADRVNAAMQAAGREITDEVFFICRSGARSQMAAQAMAEAGYVRCRNVTDGFEGPPDSDRHRGNAAGWKAAGLPWIQG